MAAERRRLGLRPWVGDPAGGFGMPSAAPGSPHAGGIRVAMRWALLTGFRMLMRSGRLLLPLPLRELLRAAGRRLGVDFGALKLRARTSLIETRRSTWPIVELGWALLGLELLEACSVDPAASRPWRRWLARCALRAQDQLHHARVHRWLAPRLYSLWIEAKEPSATEVEAQRDQAFLWSPTISLLSVLFAPSASALAELLESLDEQTYPHWELLVAVAAGSDEEPLVSLRQRARENPRIRILAVAEGPVGEHLNRCLDEARGAYVGVVDLEDRLARRALFTFVAALQEPERPELVYCDEDRLGPAGQRSHPEFKCGWSPEALLSLDCVGRLCLIGRSRLRASGGYDPELEAALEHDLLLRLDGAVSARHLPEVLYHRRAHEPSAAELAAQRRDGGRAIQRALRRCGSRLEVVDGPFPPACDVQASRDEHAAALVSILVPSHERLELLRACLSSVFERSTHRHLEVLVLENNSRDPALFAYYRALTQTHGARARVLRFDRPFNYAALNNRGAEAARGELLLLLNNDTEVIAPDWLERMMEHALRPEIGCVGAKLRYTNETIQHGGVILGLSGLVNHAHRHYPAAADGYLGRLRLLHNLSAVTGACLMVRRKLYQELGGMDERYAVAFNDVDLCLRAREAGYRNVFVPRAELYHHESATRGQPQAPSSRDREQREARRLMQRWRATIERGDPYYNPNLTLTKEDFSLAP